MPIATIQTPDGRIVKVEVPEGATNEQIMAFVQANIPAQQEVQPEIPEQGFVPFGAVPERIPQGTQMPILPQGPVAGLVSGAVKTVGGISQVLAKAGELKLFPGLPAAFPAGTEQKVSEFFQPTVQKLQQRFGDKPGFTTAEIVTQAAPALAVPAIAGRTLTKRVVGGGVTGGGFGAIGFRPEATEAERTEARKKSIVTGAKIGLGVVGGIEVIKKGLGALTPQSLTGIRKILDPKDKLDPSIIRQRKSIAEFKLLERASKKPLDALLSEVTSSPKVAAFEKSVASSSRVSDRAFNEVQMLAEKALSNLDDVATKLAKTPKGEIATGRLLKSAVNRAVNSAFLKRSVDAEKKELGGYGFVRKIAGKKAFVTNDNLVKAYEEIIKKANNVGDKSLARKAFNELKNVTGKTRNVDDMISLRSHYSNASKGSERVISDKLNPKESSKFGAALLKAYQKDIKSAESIEGVSESLKAANKLYAKNSASIEHIRNSVLGKLLNVKGGENPLSAFAKKLKTMDAEQLSDTMNIIRNIYPNAEGRVGRFIIIEAAKKARLGGEAIAGAAKTKITGKPEIISLRKFIDAMPDDERFTAIFKQPKARKEIKIILAHMKRLADRPNIGGAGGQPASTTKDIAGNIASGGAGQAKIFAARFAANPLFNRFFEKALFTEEGRRAMLILTRTKPVPPAVIITAVRTLEALTEE